MEEFDRHWRVARQVQQLQLWKIFQDIDAFAIDKLRSKAFNQMKTTK